MIDFIQFNNDDLPYEFYRQNSGCYVLENVIVRVDGRFLKIFTDEKRFIKSICRNHFESFWDDSGKTYTKTLYIDEYDVDSQDIKHVIEEDCFLVYDPYETAYAHWIFDTFPKCYYYDLLVKQNPSLKLTWLNTKSHTVDFIKQSLDLKYGQDFKNYKPISFENELMFFKKIYIPVPFYLMNICPDKIPDRLIDFYKNISSNINSNEQLEKVYISRQDVYKRLWWHNRHLRNEVDLIEKLKEKGYSIIELMDHPVSKKIGIFKYSNKIVQLTGSGAANIVFCQPNTECIFIAHPVFSKWFHPHLKWICDRLGCKFQSIRENVRVTSDKLIDNAPWEITDLENLVKLL